MQNFSCRNNGKSLSATEDELFKKNEHMLYNTLYTDNWSTRFFHKKVFYENIVFDFSKISGKFSTGFLDLVESKL